MFKPTLLKIAAWLSGYTTPALEHLSLLAPKTLFCTLLSQSPSAQRLLPSAPIDSWETFTTHFFRSHDHLSQLHLAFSPLLFLHISKDHLAHLPRNTQLLHLINSKLLSLYRTLPGWTTFHSKHPSAFTFSPFNHPTTTHLSPTYSITPKKTSLTIVPPQNTHTPHTTIIPLNNSPSSILPLTRTTIRPSMLVWKTLRLWQLLQITPPANPHTSTETIKQLYRRKIQSLHPDRNPNPNATTLSANLTQAYAQYIRTLKALSL